MNKIEGTEAGRVPGNPIEEVPRIDTSFYTYAASVMYQVPREEVDNVMRMVAKHAALSLLHGAEHESAKRLIQMGLLKDRSTPGESPGPDMFADSGDPDQPHYWAEFEAPPGLYLVEVSQDGTITIKDYTQDVASGLCTRAEKE